jgi:predicted adenylyl cyclase CyaB
MTNIEIKARCADPSNTRRRLATLGLRPAERMRQVDTYFHCPHGRLKLREIHGQEAHLIQYHRADDATAHSSDYVIAPVGVPEFLKEVLARALGVRVVVKKTREVYLWHCTRIHLDEVAGLGTFVELETVLMDQSVAEAEQECREVQAALGIREGDLIAGSYADLMEDLAPGA